MVYNWLRPLSDAWVNFISLFLLIFGLFADIILIIGSSLVLPELVLLESSEILSRSSLSSSSCSSFWVLSGEEGEILLILVSLMFPFLERFGDAN